MCASVFMLAGFIVQSAECSHSLQQVFSRTGACTVHIHMKSDVACNYLFCVWKMKVKTFHCSMVLRRANIFARYASVSSV